jgi:hypothetical protein
MPIKKGISVAQEKPEKYPSKDDIILNLHRIIDRWYEMYEMIRTERDLLWFKLYGEHTTGVDGDLLAPSPGTPIKDVPDTGLGLFPETKEPAHEPEIGAPYRPERRTI